MVNPSASAVESCHPVFFRGVWSQRHQGADLGRRLAYGSGTSPVILAAAASSRRDHRLVPAFVGN